MKELKLIKALGFADEKYVLEADPRAQKNRNLRKRIISSSAAACLALVFIGVNVWLFTPLGQNPGTTQENGMDLFSEFTLGFVQKLVYLLSPAEEISPPDISAYEGSEYYELAQKLSVYYTAKPKYKNNFVRIAEEVFGVKFYNPANSSTLGGSTSTQNYAETTDNQVKAVIEGDILKRSDKYIYYIADKGTILRVYSIEDDTPVLLTEHTFQCNIEGVESPEWRTNYEIYLSEDCTTLTYIADGKGYVYVSSLDVSDPLNIYEKASFYTEGLYVTSRVSGGKLILVVSNIVGIDDLKYLNIAPTYNLNDGKGSYKVSAANIIMPNELRWPEYHSVFLFDANTLGYLDTYTVFGPPSRNAIYVSNENIYLPYQYSVHIPDKEKGNDKYVMHLKTDIVCLNYSGDKLKHKNTFTVTGRVDTRFQLDESDGILRVATSTLTVGRTLVDSPFEKYTYYKNEYTNRSASLFCIDVNSGEILASVEDFAPLGEEVKSVRYDGNYAYICTSELDIITDPVFFFDLSDLNNITYTDTGTIPGYSTSLVNLGEGFLLGIGYNENRHLKIEVYKEGENKVESVCIYNSEDRQIAFSQNYKAYYIDRKNNIVGLGTIENSVFHYVILRFDGDKFIEICSEERLAEEQGKNISYNHTRASLLGDTLYIFYDEYVFSEKIIK